MISKVMAGLTNGTLKPPTAAPTPTSASVITSPHSHTSSSSTSTSAAVTVITSVPNKQTMTLKSFLKDSSNPASPGIQPLATPTTVFSTNNTLAEKSKSSDLITDKEITHRKNQLATNTNTNSVVNTSVSANAGITTAAGNAVGRGVRTPVTATSATPTGAVSSSTHKPQVLWTPGVVTTNINNNNTASTAAPSVNTVLSTPVQPSHQSQSHRNQLSQSQSLPVPIHSPRVKVSTSTPAAISINNDSLNTAEKLLFSIMKTPNPHPNPNPHSLLLSSPTGVYA